MAERTQRKSHSDLVAVGVVIPARWTNPSENCGVLSEDSLWSGSTPSVMRTRWLAGWQEDLPAG